MNFLLNSIIFFLTLIIMFIVFVVHITKIFLNKIRELSNMDEKNKEIIIENNILSWHGKTIKLLDIKEILYGLIEKDKYIFWYVLKNENIYHLSSSSCVELYDSRKHIEDIKNAIILKNIFEEKTINVIPSLWLMKPVGLMSCNITGGFKKGDFLTLAGDDKQICIYQGLDCNPSNFPVQMIDIDLLYINDIFTRKNISTFPNRFESEYQAYLIHKDVILNNQYLFLPWINGKFLFNDSSYHENLDSLKEEIINYFKSKNNKLVISKKNCIDRNNP